MYILRPATASLRTLLDSSRIFMQPVDCIFYRQSAQQSIVCCVFCELIDCAKWRLHNQLIAHIHRMRIADTSQLAHWISNYVRWFSMFLYSCKECLLGPSRKSASLSGACVSDASAIYPPEMLTSTLKFVRRIDLFVVPYLTMRLICSNFGIASLVVEWFWQDWTVCFVSLMHT